VLDGIHLLNVTAYTLHYGSGIDEPSAYIRARNINISMMWGFSSRDLITVLRNHNEGEAEYDSLSALPVLRFRASPDKVV
jgi:hypothetical protein